MKPAMAVEQLVALAESAPDDSDDDWINALVVAGADPILAESVVRFAPVAFGRIMLQEMGVELSPEYVRFRGDGSISQEGRLADVPTFRAATAAIPDVREKPAFVKIAVRSSEVDGVHQAMEGGSHPADLVLTPVILFDEPPSDTCLKNVQALIAEFHGQHAPPKPWWKFWA